MGDAKRRKQVDPTFGKPWWQKKSIHIQLETEPDYSSFVDLYLSQGTAGLTSAILDWLVQTEQVYQGEPPAALLNRLNQIAMTVYDMASKQTQTLASQDLKLAAFTLKVPMEPEDFSGYQPVMNNRELATEAMRLINTGFFDTAITFLINKDGDAVGTLRKHGIVLYMGTNNNLEIIDAACALVTWKPFEVTTYAGENRNSLNSLIEKTFRPLAEKIQKFRIEQKGANKFPCLSLLCLIENKTDGAVCEFRKHYTAQGGTQLIIPGFSSTTNNVVAVYPAMNVLGLTRSIPAIRGFSQKSSDS
ncbi:hypothetical protein ACE1B6_26170 [Aerosakkonemataceae cyanobacterium BLCC-F154]|uniref:Uncharacterized protein n=1 Tax=Floridaenema fluviatile BLCC-F154 TaxID=3153640 RepID=A0ABV4YJQ9_9CYAN